MNTYILIPIKDIEAEIKHNREYLNSLKRNERDNSSDMLEQKTEFLEELLERKQISLDEKDIEEKANLLYTKQSENPPYCEIKNIRAIEGYKQALKDLL